MPRSLTTCLTLTSAVLLAVAGPAPAADWPRFRGPDLDGISKETGLARTWPEKGPEVLWRVPIGGGYSALSVAGGRVYTMYDMTDGEHLAAHDAATGALVWKLKTDDKRPDGMGGGPRSTPAVDGDTVFALSANGKLHAVAAATGKSRWSYDLRKEHGDGVIPQWGVSTEPLVLGELLLVNAGGAKGHGVIAFDKKTGAIRWHAEDEGPGYSSPLPITVAGKQQVLFFTAGSLLSLTPAEGKRLWQIPWKTDYDVNAATPIFVPPNRVFVSSGYSTGSALLALDTKKDGSVEVNDVWRSKVLKNQFSSSILVKGHLYGFDNRIFKCVNLQTGEETWKESGLGHGSLTYADGLLYVLSEQGRLVLVEATPGAYREKGSLQVFESKCWTVPTLSGGKLYVRDEKELVCLKVGA